MKYRIELSEEQMSLIAQCVEDVSRFASGQWEMQNTIEAMVKGLPFDEQMKRCNEAEEFLRQTKRVLLPELHDNSSSGYNGTDFIGNTYQIYRTILHQFAKDKNWNNVYSSSALPSGSLGTIKIQACVSDSAVSDVFENLFTDKYSKKEKLDLLSKCESDGSLKLLIKKYHPKYYIEHRNMVMSITLAKDLGFV